ncbi:hypothetical protein CYMTET_37837 [Cymbomonas tetramitiformis]|uniref:Uncharacterized protein n=1 Tax=Cymbomonas tetramitiformis TaxID=36881 RepID=A0AAE0F5J9_9CHLO|nr:hypothetical protein CYMTET_37837 [Cymbomonas tetramitiformis]
MGAASVTVAGGVINELLYDTLTYIVEPGSVAYGYLLGTDSATDRDGRRALIDLIKGCVPPAVRQKHQAEHSALRYPARVTHGLFWPWSSVWFERIALRIGPHTPTAATRKAQLWAESLDPVFYAAVKYAGSTPGTAAAVGVPGDEKPDRDDILGRLLAKLEKIEAFIKTQRLGGVSGCSGRWRAAAFAAAVEQHGAPAMVSAGAASGGVDISAYGFVTVASEVSGDNEMDVQEELRDLRYQIGEAISMGQVSVPPGQKLSFAGVSTESRRPIVHSAGGAQSSLMAHVRVPTEEFPGGVEHIPVRHRMPTAPIDPPVSAVECSFPRTAASFVEPEGKSRAPIDDLFSDLDEEDSPPPIDGGPRAVTSCGVSAVRPQQVAGYCVPPFGMRPSFLMLACLVGLLCFCIARAAAGFGDVGTSTDGISVTEDPVMCKGALCIYSGVDNLSPEARQQVLQLFAAAGGGMAAAAPGGESASEHGGVATWVVP